MSKEKRKQFSEKLLKWFATNHRPMPWKGIKNPYYIWLSEIILQQTRVEQGLPYYEHFVKKYPTVFDLASAEEDVVMKSWEGLGYYSRARNLHAAARQIVFDLKGIFPNTYDTIIQLKGVGPYTAAAIASFGFDLPHAVVDGNVYRVLSRVFGIDKPIDSTEGKKIFSTLAEELMNRKRPADYNQAIMDFGATLCTPKNPNCESCPFSEHCTARVEARIQDYPVKSKKIKKKNRFFNYLVLSTDGQVLLNKRTAKDIWTNLYDFPMAESDALLEKAAFEKVIKEQNILPGNAVFEKVSKPFQQMLTHQKISARFWEYRIKSISEKEKKEYILVHKDKLPNFAFPKIIDRYLGDNSLYLELG